MDISSRLRKKYWHYRSSITFTSGDRGERPHHRMLKKASLLTRPTPARQDALYPKQCRSELSLIRGGWDDPNCAQRSHPPTHWHVETCHLPGRGPSNSLYLPVGEWPRLPSTARIERAQSHRARSASKEGTWPLPPHPSEAARCASTGIVPATPSSLFIILLDASACVFERQVPRLNETNIRQSSR